MGQTNYGVVAIAALIIGIIGGFALLYPNTTGGTLALGALLPIAGGIGVYFFHTDSQSFLGTQLAAQREHHAALATLSATTGTPSSGPSTPTTTPSIPLSEIGGLPNAAQG